MNIFANGLAIEFNGLLSTLHHVVSPITVAVILSVMSLAFLATFEVEELNRQGIKPVIERH